MEEDACSMMDDHRSSLFVVIPNGFLVVTPPSDIPVQLLSTNTNHMLMLTQTHMNVMCAVCITQCENNASQQSRLHYLPDEHYNQLHPHLSHYPFAAATLNIFVPLQFSS